ncbi:MAG: hypothetical protein M1820_006040 [Bogoriella megaspora]|nr:MAG: hypothetical protein M1820_006040 [Bogoriella megaspora]
MPRREGYEYAAVNLDETGATAVPPEKAPKSFGSFRNFLNALQTAASQKEEGNGSSRSWSAALLISFVFNILLVVALAQTYRKGSKSDVSEYAQVPVKHIAWEFNSLYGSAGADEASEKEADRMWEAYTASGVIALEKSQAEAWQLPAAQDFPWNKDYSLYVISGMRNLHCLKRMRRSVVLAHRNEPQMDDYDQLLHCFDMVRQDILCHADDTPMYTSDINSQLDGGEGQTRFCRDWGILEQWYQDNTACFAYINETQGVSDELERYKYCPRDSQFAPAMRKHFGLPDDWYEEPVENVPPY